MKVTKYCGEIKAMEQVINWVSPMVMEKARYLKDSVELADLMLAKRELADLITKRDALLRTEQNQTGYSDVFRVPIPMPYMFL